MFDRAAFESGFNGRIKILAKAEKLTKEGLRDLSRELLLITQETEDIGYVNRTLEVLSPANKRVCVLFFREFSGFLFSDESNTFVKKDKKRYDDIKAKAIAFLDDPHNNVWTWQERNVDIEAKPFDLTKVTAFATNVLKKAEKEGVSQVDVLNAFFAAGFKPEALMAVMDKMTAAQ
jgi:hypothetical protein